MENQETPLVILEKSELTNKHKEEIKLMFENIDINDFKYNFMMKNLIDDIKMLEEMEKEISENDNN